MLAFQFGFHPTPYRPRQEVDDTRMPRFEAKGNRSEKNHRPDHDTDYYRCRDSSVGKGRK
ncbi:Uncharacterised protein [Mycobacteroides abscessus subsp. abscessus]|nr:Uncharacterised protein [Mycobacteroides abscessus subsp. abscessus]